MLAATAIPASWDRPVRAPVPSERLQGWLQHFSVGSQKAAICSSSASQSKKNRQVAVRPRSISPVKRFFFEKIISLL
jgi:hypothetical protein